LKKLISVLLMTCALLAIAPLAFAQSSPLPADDASFDDLHALQLKRYKPFYFIAGKADMKGQISFKVPVVEGTGLYIGYTQLFIWDVYKPSGPMRDVNYNPEAFYRFNLNGSHYTALDLGLFEHESNGLAGTSSRQWNRTYLRFHEEYKKAESALHLIWEAKVWYQFMDDPGNVDIERYRGTYELNMTLAGMGHTILNINDLTLRIFPGGPSTADITRGGQELDWRIMGSKRLLVPIFIQLYHGYGENLLDYKRKQWMLRAGIGF
jgi:phospholipase A1